MAKNTEARDASEFNLPRPRRLKEFLDERVIIANFSRKTYQDKPYYEVTLIVESTGEQLVLNTGNKYVLAFLDSLPDATVCPIQAIFYTKGGQSRSILVRGWNKRQDEPDEPEVEFDE